MQEANTPLRIVVCWSEISGYMAACWRELAKRTDVELFVVAFKSGTGIYGEAAFADDVMSGVPHRLLALEERGSLDLITSIVKERRPQVIFVTGWFVPSYRKLAYQPGLESVPFVLGIDTPRRPGWRQHAVRLKVGRHLRRMAGVMVAGERAWQYARFLGVPEARIRRGMYGVDVTQFTPLLEQRLARGPWPRKFLYTGRYVQPKAIDILVEAYRRYRAAVSDPWPLTCCGNGNWDRLMVNQPGVTDRGFVQPRDLGAVFLEHGVFILPSRFDPWPLVVVEAAAAGLPIICTEACGSGVEVVRSYYNGIPVATANVDALLDAMRWMHEHHADLPEMGRRGTDLASAYSATMWAQRWHRYAEECMGGRDG
jgi:glycosyltransferase involved in cell wall biosynthesis